jgi:hypothetical protein
MSAVRTGSHPRWHVSGIASGFRLPIINGLYSIPSRRLVLLTKPATNPLAGERVRVDPAHDGYVATAELRLDAPNRNLVPMVSLISSYASR